MDKEQYISNSYDDTIKIAYEFANKLRPGDVICMYGDLGAGKTAFTQGLAKGLDIHGYVNSPTFTIVNVYSGRLELNHFDAYRVGDSDEMLDIGFDEMISGDAVSVIEWAELIEDILPEERYNITVAFVDDTKREITIERKG